MSVVVENRTILKAYAIRKISQFIHSLSMRQRDRPLLLRA